MLKFMIGRVGGDVNAAFRSRFRFGRERMTEDKWRMADRDRKGCGDDRLPSAAKEPTSPASSAFLRPLSGIRHPPACIREHG